MEHHNTKDRRKAATRIVKGLLKEYGLRVNEEQKVIFGASDRSGRSEYTLDELVGRNLARSAMG